MSFIEHFLKCQTQAKIGATVSRVWMLDAELSVPKPCAYSFSVNNSAAHRTISKWKENYFIFSYFLNGKKFIFFKKSQHFIEIIFTSKIFKGHSFLFEAP